MGSMADAQLLETACCRNADLTPAMLQVGEVVRRLVELDEPALSNIFVKHVRALVRPPQASAPSCSVTSAPPGGPRMGGSGMIGIGPKGSKCLSLQQPGGSLLRTCSGQGAHRSG